MRVVSLVLPIILLLSLPAVAATWHPLEDPADPAQPVSISVVEGTAAYTVIEIVVHGVHLEPATLDGKEYVSLSLADGRITRPGHPEVPVVTRVFAIPTSREPQLSVLDLEESTIARMRIVPVQVKPDRCGTGGHPRLACDLSIYNSGTSYPGLSAEVLEVGSMRDIHFAQIRFHPVQFEPATETVRIARKMVVRIDHPGAAFLHTDKVVPTFHRLYKSIFLNYQETLFDEVSHVIERIAIITADKFEDGLTPFVAWKEQMGFQVDVYKLGDVGTSASQVKNHLQTIYDNPLTRPTYVILVGDKADMPTLSGIDDCASDFKYSQLEGMDLMSDVLVSRISVKNADELARQLEKFIWYEQAIPAGPDSDWLSGAVGISSSEGSGGSNDDVRMNIVTGMQTDYGYDPVDKFYHSYNNDTATEISAVINDGRGFVTYMGHGSGTAWATTSPHYSVTHINQLVNAWQLVTVMDVSCSNGGFDDHDACFAESWMRAHDKGDPTGAVAIYSASTPTPWDEPAEMAIGVIDALLNDDSLYRWADLCYAGRLYSYNIFGSNNNIKEVFQQYIVFGDGSLGIRSQAPRNLIVDGPDVLPVGGVQESFLVKDDSGAVVPDALVHLMKAGEVDKAAYTGSNGEVTFSIVTTSPGDLNVVVTAVDAVPYVGAIDVMVTGCGVLKASQNVVSCQGQMTVTLWDQDLNLDGDEVDIATVACQVGGTEFSVLLSETGADTNMFTNGISLGPLGLMDGGLVTFTYEDDGCNGEQATVSVSVGVDCMGPVVTGVEVLELQVTSATVVFTTSEQAGSDVVYGPVIPNIVVPATSGVQHLAVLEGLTPATPYFFKVMATDNAGNLTEDSNGGQYYSFETPDCAPDCVGKACGPDGCGGSCGDCEPDQECNSGGVCYGGPGCEPMNTPGCGGCKCEECVCAQDSYCCQWEWDDICVEQCLQDCEGCGSGGCVPVCADQECGDDGCGGSCGDCSPDAECKNGTCETAEDPCQGLAYQGCCAGNVLYWCDEGLLESLECNESDCGWSTDYGYYDCNEQGLPDPSGDYPLSCPWIECAADCVGKNCGPDGCGGSCGVCEEGSNCKDGACHEEICIPDCEDKNCGPDGCGGQCGKCESDQACSDGLCECEADCLDVECGDDGCSGSCGECADGLICIAGDCVCLSQCLGKQCGDDGCGSSCGECPAGESCNNIGLCAELSVTPDLVTGSDIAVTGDTVSTYEDVNGEVEGGISNLSAKKSGGCSATGTSHGGSAMMLLALMLLAIVRQRSVKG
jgi:uncharacterized protein (TIGR03382 family)